jgi:hypothetical protein
MFRLLWCLSIAFSLSLHAGAQEIPDESAQPAAAKTPETGKAEITPSHVYRQVALVRAEIDLIRLEMGKPEVDPPPIQVEKAAPREVYFQAATLFRKADRLAFEHTRGRVEEPPMPAGQMRPAGVHAMVSAALERVETVKETLTITEQSESPPLDPGLEPSQVFNAIVAANRELNHLLDQRFAPRDVYQQVSMAIAYLSRLLDSPGVVSTPPEPPPFERRKRPADVYRRLVGCFDQIHQLGEESGVPMLDLKVDEQQVERVDPSDAYDIASLLVSELAHLHEQRVGAAPPRKVYSAGRKLPSHVYQRIGILRGQLEALQLKVQSNPDWLKD